MFRIHKWLPNGEGDVLFEHKEEGAPLAWIKSRHPLFVGLVVRSARRDEVCVLVWESAVQMSTGRGWPHNAPIYRVTVDGADVLAMLRIEHDNAWFDREYWRVHGIALERVLRGLDGARQCGCYGPPMLTCPGTCQGQEHGCWMDTACRITVAVAKAAMRGDAAEKITTENMAVNTGKDDWEVW